MKKNNLTTRLAAACCLSVMLCTGCHNDNDPAQLLPSEGGIALTPTIESIMAWNEGDNNPSTRADNTVDAKLAVGGKIGIKIVAPHPTEDGPSDEVLAFNYYKVTDQGKLERIPFSGATGETEENLSIPEAGEYYVMGSANVNLTTGGFTYRAYADNAGRKITIEKDGKISLPLAIKSGGVRLNVKSNAGGIYDGGAVEATPVGFSVCDEMGGGALEAKTLAADAPSAIWGELSTKAKALQQGDVVMELKVDGKTYQVKTPRALSVIAARLYEFNVRVGATSITVSEPTIGEFETVKEVEVEAEYKLLFNGQEPALLAVPGCTPYWIAPIVDAEVLIQAGWGAVANYTCPAGWRIPTKEDYEAMTGLNAGDPANSEIYSAVSAVIPYINGGRGWWSATAIKEEGQEQKAWMLSVSNVNSTVILEAVPTYGYPGHGRCVRKK